MEAENTVFKELNSVNVNGHVEKKKDLSYLSWPWAIAETLKRYPDTTWKIKMYDGKPYIYDELTGYMVFTEVTINGVTREMWLPVMDNANNAMKSKPYTYKTKFGEKTVEAATMFEINKTIMRCLVKNLAAFGLGLYIYSGEDIPTDEAEAIADAEYEKVKSKLIDFISAGVLNETEQNKTTKAIDAKNIEMMNAILATCVTRYNNKQGA